MIEDKINVKFLDNSLGREVVLEQSIEGLHNVEQLVHRILQQAGVGPVYRCLFALKLVDQAIWFAPNARLRAIQPWSQEGARRSKWPRLEVRMRFQPASFKRLARVDERALDLVFAQVRADFLRTRFNRERRSCVLLEQAVVGMIVLDLVRHALENDIPIDRLLHKVNPNDFLPQRAAPLQRMLMFHMDKQTNLRKALHMEYEQCGRDIQKLKRMYIELFHTSVAENYGAEMYVVHQIPISHADNGTIYSNSSRPNRLFLRARFVHETDGATNCVLESTEFQDLAKQHSKKLHNNNNNGDNSSSNNINGNNSFNLNKRLAALNWSQICDIRTINHATLRHNIVQLARDNGYPVRFQFKTRWHAESFLSFLDGYYRFMHKWNLNIFRDIWSPSLLALKRLSSHGPIGFLSARKKLAQFERPGDFLVRQCMEVTDRYLIDTALFGAKVMLSIHIDWSPRDRCYRLAGHSTSRDDLQVSVVAAGKDYVKLAHLIRDIEIDVSYQSEGPFRKQLKHWIQPQDDDYYPALLVCVSDKKLGQLEERADERQDQVGQMPRALPHHFIKTAARRLTNSDNGLVVHLAISSDDRHVVVKEFARLEEGPFNNFTGLMASPPRLDRTKEKYVFHVCQEEAEPANGLEDRHSCRDKVANWAFLRSPLFAETIGYVITGAFIQEHFPIGRLDEFLAANRELEPVLKLSISFQLVQAIFFLSQKKLIHGKIRCHNVMIKQFHPMLVKLTDPFGTLDVEQDQAFIPPEYFSSTVGVCVRKFYSGVDVWALGTTMWQIYSNGAHPPSGRYANGTLTQPTSCPDDVWRTVEACWVVDPNFRVTPQALFRDLCDLLSWHKEAHEYLYISPEDSDENNPEPLTSSHSKSNSMTSNKQVYDNHKQLTSIATNQNNNNNINTISATNGKAKPTGSQLNLVELAKAQLTTPLNGHNDTISTSSEGSGSGSNTTATSRSDARMISPAQHAIVRRTSWRKFISLARNHRNSQSDLPPCKSFSELFGSTSSLSGLDTPLDSDMTRISILELENISQAFDQCIWHIDSSRLKLGPEIGRGSSGVVIKGIMSQTDEEGSDRVVAVKCIDKSSSSFDINHIDDLRREFDILKDLDHENIVKALGYVEESQMMLIFEYMPLGSLLSCVRNICTADDLHKLPLQKYALDIARGMDYLESKKIVHRDLALRNILLSGRNEVKICDFGLAKSLGSEDFYTFQTERALPLKWYAPETISERVFTHKSDVWSYGVVLWEIYTGGDSPQYSGSYAELAETLKRERLPLPNKCPRFMYDLMLRCWAYTPQERMSFKQTRELLESQTNNALK